MIKLLKKRLSERDKELFLGNLVTWGSIVSALILVIIWAPVVAAEQDQASSMSQIEAVAFDASSDTG